MRASKTPAVKSTAASAIAALESEIIAVSGAVVRLRPFQYVHVHDNNTNVTRMLVGPLTYTRLDHESFVSDPKTYLCVPPSHYCIVENPVARTASGDAEVYPSGQVRTKLGDREVRFEQPPFPLYPGEVLVEEVRPLPVLSAVDAYNVAALRDFTDDQGVARKAGDEWQIRGPCVFRPNVAVETRTRLTAVAITADNALVLRALRGFTDSQGVARTTGEEWLYTKPGAFIPAVEEEVVRDAPTVVLTPTAAIHVVALRDFTDRFGKRRVVGEAWLVTNETTTAFTAVPEEQILRHVPRTVLKKGQYCVVLNPVNLTTGKPALGAKELRVGLASFFLHPGEELEGGVASEAVLAKDEGLVLSSTADTTDISGKHKAGDRWLLRGPATYIPPVGVQIVARRKAIPLDKNEGVYIRDTTSGRVRAHIGSTVLLTENEELWDKELPPLVEELLQRPRFTDRRADAPKGVKSTRVKHRVVAVNLPHDHFMQVYDFSAKTARVVRGPEQVFLQPDEQLTVVSMSAGTPKQSDLMKTLCLHCGPDFMRDAIIVETSDHARLKLEVSYNWEFDLTRPNIGDLMFNVPDFIGDACKAIASRIRGAVAGEPFDVMHKNAVTIIRGAVFDDPSGRLIFPSNGLVITNVDVHSVDPVDAKTSEALTKAVQLAIEITTSSQEAAARQTALKLEQAAKGRLERQIIKDKVATERSQKGLLELQAINAAIEATGESTAEAKAKAAALLIEGETEVALAEKRIAAETITAKAELDVYCNRRELEIGHKSQMYTLETGKTRGMAQIEAEKFTKLIAAVGRDTIKALASAGPETQAALLKGLGLQGYLVTDGSNPINLFNAARGMTAAPTLPH